MAQRFASNTPKQTPREKELEFPTLHLGWLIRFAVYVSEGKNRQPPLSFRKFMGKKGSHRTMVKAVDAIETLAEKLMIVRVVLDEEGREGKATDSYAVISKNDVESKRIGYVTDHGEAWAAFGEYVGELLDFTVETEDPEKIRRFMGEWRDQLREYRSRAERAAAQQKE